MVGPRVVQRLDAEPVARQQQPSALPIPQRERKHSLQALDAALSFCLVQVQNGLGVAASAVAVTTLFERGPKGGVIVDFAVVDDPNRPVLVGHRLPAAEHVHDREPAHPQAHRSLDPEALAVRPAVAQHVPHPRETRLVHGFPLVQFDDPHDSAHALVPNLARHDEAHGARDVPPPGPLRDRDSAHRERAGLGLVSLLLPGVGCV